MTTQLSSEQVYQRGREIIDREWLAAGVSREELDQEEEITDILDRLTGSGYAPEIVRAAWTAEYANIMELYLRMLAIAERALPTNDPMLAQILVSLARQYQASGNLSAAEPLYARALFLREQLFGVEHPSTIQTREAYAALLCTANRCDEADKLQTLLLPV